MDVFVGCCFLRNFCRVYLIMFRCMIFIRRLFALSSDVVAVSR